MVDAPVVGGGGLIWECEAALTGGEEGRF